MHICNDDDDSTRNFRPRKFKSLHTAAAAAPTKKKQMNRAQTCICFLELLKLVRIIMCLAEKLIIFSKTYRELC